MGNVPISCCRSKSPRSLDPETRGDGSNDSRKLSTKIGRQDGGPSSSTSSMHQSTQNILQHISEREPDDTETGPRSSYSIRLYSSRRQEGELQSTAPVADRLKASSCSTIFTDNSTISQPNLEQTIRSVSLAIYYHIKSRSSDAAAEIFDETLHPLRMPSCTQEDRTTVILDDDCANGPDQETIYNFVRTLFGAAQLGSEYAITTLVYLERLMTYAEMDLTPKTWRRMFLGAILLSSKVWEDQAIWNVDYAQILEEISVDDINELERQFLELIQFNMNVPSSVYAKYYFHLRTLVKGDRAPMTTAKASQLEAVSRTDWLHQAPAIRKHNSLERLRLCGNATAVLPM